MASQYETWLASLRESLNDLQSLDPPAEDQKPPEQSEPFFADLFNLDQPTPHSDPPQSLPFLANLDPPSSSDTILSEIRSPEISVQMPKSADTRNFFDPSYVDDFEAFDRSPSPVRPETGRANCLSGISNFRSTKAVVIPRTRPQSPPRRSPRKISRSQFPVLKCPRCAALWPLSAGFSAAKIFGGEPGGRDLFHEVFGEEISDPGFDLSPILSVKNLQPQEALEILSKKLPDPPAALVLWWRGLQALDEGRLVQAKEHCRRALGALPAGRLALVLHWHWALLYERDFRESGTILNRKAYERELRELRRVHRAYGAPSAGCAVCGRN